MEELRDFFGGYEKETKPRRKVTKPITAEVEALLEEMEDDLSYMDADEKVAKKDKMLDELQSAFNVDRTEASDLYDAWKRGGGQKEHKSTGEVTCGDIEREYGEMIASGYAEKETLLTLAKKYGFTVHELQYMIA